MVTIEVVATDFAAWRPGVDGFLDKVRIAVQKLEKSRDHAVFDELPLNTRLLHTPTKAAAQHAAGLTAELPMMGHPSRPMVHHHIHQPLLVPRKLCRMVMVSRLSSIIVHLHRSPHLSIRPVHQTHLNSSAILHLNPYLLIQLVHPTHKHSLATIHLNPLHLTFIALPTPQACCLKFPSLAWMAIFPVVGVLMPRSTSKMYFVEPSLWISVSEMHFEGPASLWYQSVESQIPDWTWDDLCAQIHDSFYQDRHESLI
jgi:hypothetical protein